VWALYVIIDLLGSGKTLSNPVSFQFVALPLTETVWFSLHRTRIIELDKNCYVWECRKYSCVRIFTPFILTSVRGSNPGGGEIFHTCPDRPWGPPSLLCNEYRVFSGGRKRPGRDADTSPFQMPRTKNRVGLYRYSP
jgi:hypothetical protein